MSREQLRRELRGLASSDVPAAHILMATVRRHIRINRSPDDVWARIRDAAALREWFPGLVSSDVDGSTRTITTTSGISMPEEIITIDDDLRRFQYRITSPIESHHLATIDVIEDSGESLVIYSTDISPDPMAYVFSGATGAALDELKYQMEA